MAFLRVRRRRAGPGALKWERQKSPGPPPVGLSAGGGEKAPHTLGAARPIPNRTEEPHREKMA